uniref:NADH-ubiquinone oxidoreductase chain 6 n=1 Tax=Psacothea hilaris TaxID=157325 RepID=C7ACW0_PSAHI|nr:NADH dehydrogenase subunit 6 [Psacothea hilaris]ACR44363.1 NADH dehydrogenase subunit 6 [Psacothea hilaris]
MSLILIINSLLLSFIFMFLMHPLSFGLILLLQTTMIALITGMMNFNYWFSYIIFLIMIGGMLILFIYMTSVASNEKFKFSYKLTLACIFITSIMSLLFIIDLYYFNLNSMNNLFNQVNHENFKLSMNKFMNWPMNMNFFLMIIYLLVTLIMVVKITNIQYGPLRQKI